MDDEVQGRSQLDIFTSFLLKASTYNTLPIKGRKKYAHRIVVVEDLPNVLYRDSSAFHNVLR
jgi:hypothetical protein